jgi:threonine dehydratase
MSSYPTLSEILAARRLIEPHTRRTPCLTMPARELEIEDMRGEIVFKLELLQVTGTFKARGALSVMLNLSETERARGVTAVSAGNHAIAVAYAAQVLGISARIVMLKSANAARLARARSHGAEIEIAADGPTAFARVQEIEQQEGRIFVHPFEGPRTIAGTATTGLEWFEQAEALDAVIVAVGGGGLIAGVGAALKQLAPATRVYGVEPEGADSMSRSLQAGTPITLPSVSTIADSLAPPMATPYTFGVCQRFVDRMVVIPDEAMRLAMGRIFRSLKLCVEPAGAAALAGLLGPLREELRDAKRVGVMVCGSNIDLQTFGAQALV